MSNNGQSKRLKRLTTDVFADRAVKPLPGQLSLDLEAGVSAVAAKDKAEAEYEYKLDMQCLERAYEARNQAAWSKMFEIMEERWPHASEAQAEAMMIDYIRNVVAPKLRGAKDDSGIADEPDNRAEAGGKMPVDWQKATTKASLDAGDSIITILPDDPHLEERIEALVCDKSSTEYWLAANNHILAVSYFTAWDGRQGAIQNNTNAGYELPRKAIVNEPDGAKTELDGLEVEPLKLVMISTIVTKGGSVFTGVAQVGPTEYVDYKRLRKQAYDKAYAEFSAALNYLLRHQQLEAIQNPLQEKLCAV